MKNKKSLIALLLIAVVGMVGLTIAYFTNNIDIENLFTTKEYGTTYTESFVSPDNWLPGDTTEKTLEVENTGEVDEAVRVLVNESWVSHNGDSLDLSKNGVPVAVINLDHKYDWVKVGDYYYYKYRLVPDDVAPSFIKSVTFNPNITLDNNCTETVNNGVRTIECNSSGDDYDNATYTLTFTVETVQYDKYSEAWNTGNTVQIAFDKPLPAQQYLTSSEVNQTEATYSNGNKSKMFEFTHLATDQTPALTEYRYIGNTPNNYVYFNCDDLNDQNSSTCEVWRIIGVFDVMRPDPEDNTQTITEKRLKLVRGSAISRTFALNTEAYDWSNTTLKNFLNGNYYNRSGDAATYGLKESARSMIGDAKYYLGASDTTNGSVEDIYTWERGTNVISGRDTYWIGKVGILYISDQYMVYGKGVNATCYNTPNSCVRDVSYSGWIYGPSSSTTQTEMWFISPGTDGGMSAFYSRWNGTLMRYMYVGYNSYTVKPVVYLNADVKIVDGIGSSSNPYVLQ